MNSFWIPLNVEYLFIWFEIWARSAHCSEQLLKMDERGQWGEGVKEVFATFILTKGKTKFVL